MTTQAIDQKLLRRIALLLIVFIILMLAMASCSDELDWELLAPIMLRVVR